MKKFGILFIIYSLSNFCQAQNLDSLLITRLQKHIRVLSHDSLEGRGTSTQGEEKAALYIQKQFELAGIPPLSVSQGYTLPFEYEDKKIIGVGNQAKLQRNNLTTPLKLYKNYYPLSWSGNGIAFSQVVYVGYGIQDSSLHQFDYDNKGNLQGKIFIMQTGNPDGNNPHSHFHKYDLGYRIQEAIKRGASAVVFVNNDPKSAPPDTALSLKTATLNIPVIYLKDDQFEKGIYKDGTTLFIQTEIIITKAIGKNVAAALDYGKDNWVLIGAHYDHLGRGEHGGSLHAGQKNQIHHGADDNASGTAALIELAIWIKNHPNLKQYNYAFVAFSGEELGLYGSGRFVQNCPYNIHRTNYMLNMDMVGRLDPARQILSINGTGTSPAWKILDSLPMDGIILSKSESGVGPSDHTSFYKENIPVLHFFTGSHADYHKPTDIEKLINYPGEVKVIHFMQSLLEYLDTKPRIEFKKTIDADPKSSPRFKVSLGIMPDYLYTAQGIKADGVTEGKPASKAGLQKGDIIIRLGDFQTADMTGYTKALSNFAKGMKTTVTFLRNGKEMTRDIIF